MQTNKWSADRIKEIRTWKKENKATWNEAAAEFKVSPDALMRAAHYYKGKKAKSASPSNPPKRKYMKRQKFIDLVHEAAPTTESKAVVIVCKITEIPSALKGLL